MAQESLALTVTLNQLAKLDRYNHWVYERISHALGRRVLEVGSGTGNITQFLCAGGREVTATDIVPSYRNELERLFDDSPKVRVEKFDLTAEAPDAFVGHFRRYERRELAGKLEKTGFVVREMKFFSLAAALPWLINGRLLKRDYIPAGQANLANLLVPLLKLERLIGPPCGLSLIAIAEKQMSDVRCQMSVRDALALTSDI